MKFKKKIKTGDWLVTVNEIYVREEVDNSLVLVLHYFIAIYLLFALIYVDIAQTDRQRHRHMCVTALIIFSMHILFRYFFFHLHQHQLQHHQIEQHNVCVQVYNTHTSIFQPIKFISSKIQRVRY